MSCQFPEDSYFYVNRNTNDMGNMQYHRPTERSTYPKNSTLLYALHTVRNLGRVLQNEMVVATMRNAKKRTLFSFGKDWFLVLMKCSLRHNTALF